MHNKDEVFNRNENLYNLMRLNDIINKANLNIQTLQIFVAKISEIKRK